MIVDFKRNTGKNFLLNFVCKKQDEKENTRETFLSITFQKYRIFLARTISETLNETNSLNSTFHKRFIFYMNELKVIQN